MAESDAPGSVDVLVIGGGPAGSAAALLLAKQGWQVAIADRPQPRTSRIVETLPPPSRSTLKSLGVWTRFVTAGHVPADGIVSWWDSAHPVEHDFILNPSGGEWHVDRRSFDRLIASAAIEAGAVLLPVERLVDATVEAAAASRDPWRVRLVANGRPREMFARFLVNASGRTTAFRPGESRRRPIDRLVGLAAVVESASTGVDRRSWIEATPSGWWYSAPGIDGRWSAVFFTDADLAGGSCRRTLAARWSQAVAEAPRTAGRLREIGFPSPDSIGLHVLAANSYTTSQCQGRRWLAVGDAASAVDPLSGQGIERALRGAIRAARTVDAILTAEARADEAGAQAALDEYQGDQRAFDCEYLWQRQECYARVRRWPDRPFWQRRTQQSLA